MPNLFTSSHRLGFSLCFALAFLLPSLALAQATPTRDPAALTLATQSLQALTGGTTINDLTLQGSAT
jgi:hypothetical protein